MSRLPGTAAALRRRFTTVRRTDERGSIVPLILGFWLIALLFIGGAVALSDAYTKRRDLQSICDSAALAGANSVTPDAVHGAGLTGSAVPLGQVDQAVAAFLARDADRAGTQAQTGLEADGVTVDVTCTHHTSIAFGALLMRRDGIDQQVHASARNPLIP